MSRFHFLADEEIMASLVTQTKTIRACCLDQKTTFLVLTVPANSTYIEKHHLDSLVRLFLSTGLAPRLCQASGSDDIQIYLSFSAQADTVELTVALTNLLLSAGYELSNQTLVVHATDLPFVLPLQPGFAWLNSDFEPKLRRDEIALQAAMALFLDELKAAAVDPALLLDFSLIEKQDGGLLAGTIDDLVAQVESIEDVFSLESQTIPDRGEASQDPVLNLESVAVIDKAEEAELESKVESSLCSEVVFADNSKDMQLLLFPISTTEVDSEFPQSRKQRGRKARSDPSSMAEITLVSDKVFPGDQTDHMSVPSREKEVANDQ